MDPRTERTRQHVVRVASDILREQGAAAVTFSTVASAARVARPTLYRLWGSPAQLLVDVMLAPHEESSAGAQTTDRRAFLREFLYGIRDGLAQADTEAALAGVIGLATHDPAADAALVEANRRRIESLAEGIGPVREEDYSFIVGPLFFEQLIARHPVDDAFVDDLVDTALTRLARSRDLDAP